MMLPLVFLPLASIFIFGTSKGFDSFWARFDRTGGDFRAETFDRHELLGHGFQRRVRTVRGVCAFEVQLLGPQRVIVTISLPTAIPTAVAGFALLLLVGTVRDSWPTV